MFEQILVPLDESTLAEHILPHAVAIAQAFNSKVKLISVLDPFARSAHSQTIDPWDWQIQRAEAETYLKDLSSRLKELGLQTETILLEGKAPDNIIHHSDFIDTNLIMVSSHGQGGISGWNVSSVGMKIIQQARTSVMILRSYSPPEESRKILRYRRILAPIDGSRRAEYGLHTAAHLARAHEADLLIAHVIKPPELPRRTPFSAQDQTLLQQVVESNRAEASHYLETLKASLDCKVETCLLVNDHVAESLHNLVEQELIDLVLLSAHGLGGNPRWPYGNVTANLLAYCTAPLLIVQDFSRNQLYQTRAESFANEFASQQQLPVMEVRSQSSAGREPE